MRLRRFMRATSVVAALVVLSGALGAGLAEAAPGGDAMVVAKAFGVDVSGSTPAGSATVMCPTGTRATGGGVAPTAPFGTDNYRVQASGPVNSSGGQIFNPGDIARGWLSTVSVFADTTTTATFRAFALCSRDSDATVQIGVPSAGPIWSMAVQCPSGQRALSGGALPLTPVPNGQELYVFHASNPVGAAGTTDSIDNGGVPTGWLTSVDSNGSGTAPHFFAVCSAKSDAVVQAASLTLPAAASSSQPTVGSATVTCPSGRRVVGGGIGVGTADDASDRVEYYAPIGPAGTVGGTKTGDIAKKFVASARNNTAAERVFRVMALCAGSERRPDALIKRSSESTYVGGNVYYPTAQVRAWSARRGQTRSFTLRFENDGDTDAFVVTGCHSRTTYKITYINPASGTNVTTKVTSSTGYVLTNMAHNAVKTLVLRFKPTSAATIGSVPACRVVARSKTVTTLRDAVTAKVKVVKG